MVNWLIVVGLVVVLLVLLRFRKMEHLKTRVYVVVVIFLLIFFYLTISGVIEKNKVDIKTFDGVVSAGKLYFSWLGQVFTNSKVIAGNAVKMDWAGNSTGK
jgi:glucan phosphoethanolaminetransferase (alkaline phosphatase superfamily)